MKKKPDAAPPVRLARWRFEARMTLTEVGEAARARGIGGATSTLSLMENGKARVTEQHARLYEDLARKRREADAAAVQES